MRLYTPLDGSWLNVADDDEGSGVDVDRPIWLAVVFDPQPASSAKAVSALKMLSNR
jgi:hypothetical protein